MPHVTTDHINVKENLAALMALYRWPPLLCDSHVVIFTDNVTTKAIFNKVASRQPRIIDHMRCVYWLAQRFNFKVMAEHLPGTDNTVADSISCMSSLPHAQFIFSLASQASPLSPSAFAYCCHPHMSFKSLHCLLQAHHWDPPLTPQLPPSVAMPLPPTPNNPIAPICIPTWNSVPGWIAPLSQQTTSPCAGMWPIWPSSYHINASQNILI